MTRVSISKEQWVDLLRRSRSIVVVGEGWEGWTRISKVRYIHPDTGLNTIGVVHTRWVEEAKYLVELAEAKEDDNNYPF